MKCPNCGEETNSAFCPKCGSNLSLDMSNKTVTSQNIPQNNYNSSSQKKKNSTLGIIALILSFLGPIGAILGIVDLVKDKNRTYKHGLSIAAIVIGSLVCIAIASPSGNKENSKNTTEIASETSSEETTSPETDTSSDANDPEEASSDFDISDSDDNSSIEESDSNAKKHEADEPKITKKDFIASCTELNYKQIARDPESYIGQNFSFTCYVSSAREGGLLTGYQKYYVTYYFDMSKAQDAINDGWADSLSDASFYGTDYDKTVWLLDNRDSNDKKYVKILENDIITVYGTFTGMTETKNSLTNESGEVVSLDIKYVELLAE